MQTHGPEGQGTAGTPQSGVRAHPAATPPGTPPPDGKARQPTRDEQLAVACRGLIEAAYELSWAAYLLGARQMPGGRADAARVRGLCLAAFKLVAAVEDVAAPLVESGALLPLFDDEALGELTDAGALLAFDLFTELAGYGARLERLARR